MAVRKKATKTKSKAESGLSEIKVSTKTKNSAVKTLKRTSAKAFLIAFIFLIVGCLGGVGAWWLVCKNDTFELIGKEELVFTLNETYDDQGVKIVAFGKDESETIKIETNLLTDSDGNYYSDEVGTFYIKYTSSSFKYGSLFKVEKVRLITFVETSEGGV